MKKEYVIKITGVITIDDMEPEPELKHQFKNCIGKKKMRSGGAPAEAIDEIIDPTFVIDRTLPKGLVISNDKKDNSEQ